MEKLDDDTSASMHAVVIRHLPANTPEILRALNAEFYGGELAHADAFRVLPIIADAMEVDKQQTWPLRDVLSKLTDAAETLLNQYTYDGHGYEEINACIVRAKAILSD